MRSGRRVWLIAGLVVLATLVLVVGVLVGLRLGGRTHPSVQSALRLVNISRRYSPTR